MSKLRIGQFCRFSRIRYDEYRVYQFCLFLDNTVEELRSIAQVVYTLDPSFPTPTRTVPNSEIPYSDRDHCFALQSEAWGSFLTRVLIVEEGGKTTRLEHRLVMEESGWPMGEKFCDFGSQTVKAVYEALFDPKSEWRKLSTLSRRAGVSIEEVRTALLELEATRAVRQAYYKSLEGEELWGATATVGILPTPAG